MIKTMIIVTIIMLVKKKKGIAHNVEKYYNLI